MQRHPEPHYILTIHYSSSHSTLITSSTALDTGLAVILQETSPLAPYKKETFTDLYITRWTSLRTLWWIREQLEQHFVTSDQNWLLSRPLCFTSKLTPFKILCSNVYGKMSEIDSFQDPCVLQQNWLLSRPQAFFDTNRLISTLCAVNYLKHHPIDSFQDPHIGLLQCFNLHGRLPAKSPWGTSSIQNSSKHPTQWILDFIVKQWRKTHHMQAINTFQQPGATYSTLDTTIFIKTNSFQDPRNFRSTSDSSIHLKTLSSRHWHRTRTPLQFISQICTNSLVTLRSLRAHYVP